MCLVGLHDYTQPGRDEPSNDEKPPIYVLQRQPNVERKRIYDSRMVVRNLAAHMVQDVRLADPVSKRGA
jgi:hypothetical protein